MSQNGFPVTSHLIQTSNKNMSKYHPQTDAIRLQMKRTNEKEHSTPLFLTSSFVYNSAEDMAAAFSDYSLEVNIYSSFSNTTVD